MPSHYGKSKMKSKSKGLKGGQKRLPMALKKKIILRFQSHTLQENQEVMKKMVKTTILFLRENLQI